MLKMAPKWKLGISLILRTPTLHETYELPRKPWLLVTVDEKQTLFSNGQ